MPFKFDRRVRNKIISGKFFAHSDFDPFLKWAPFCSLFVLDTFGFKTKHSFKQHIFLAGLCESLQAVTTESLKSHLKELRPQPSLSMRSFPSGHAATSFAGAEILRTELKSGHPVLSWTGYVVAVAASGLRLYNNKHWLSDVVAGAVIGFVSARLTVALFKKLDKRKKMNYEDRDILVNSQQ